jgi:hypothetical protein
METVRIPIQLYPTSACPTPVLDEGWWVTQLSNLGFRPAFKHPESKSGGSLMRKRIWATGVLVACLAVPTTAFAGQPAEKDKTNAAKECKAERGDTDATREAFAAKYGKNKNGKNAFGKCVSARAQEEKAERKEAKANASRDCREERKELGVEAFRAKYGTNKNKRNAFGKCVSKHAKKEKKAMDRADRREIERAHDES